LANFIQLSLFIII